jgi:hypothetical protein
MVQLVWLMAMALVIRMFAAKLRYVVAGVLILLSLGATAAPAGAAAPRRGPPTSLAAIRWAFDPMLRMMESGNTGIAALGSVGSSSSGDRQRSTPFGCLLSTNSIDDAPLRGTTSAHFVATKPGSGPQLFDNLAPGDVARSQGIPTSKLGNMTGRFNYVVLEDGTLLVAKQSYGHIDLANGARVQAAGEVQIVNGQVRAINNASGHYKPSGQSAQTAAENAFANSGASVRPGAYTETK